MNQLRNLCGGLLAFCVLAMTAGAQVQQAWVARYTNGIPNGTNQAVAMVLDNAGNVYVTGYSQNANSNLDYVTIKYTPGGNLVWVARFDSTNHVDDVPVGLVLDKDTNVIVTGTSATVKYDSNGTQLWTAPYGGKALAVDADGNVFVTGFLSYDFATVKLAPNGTNIWLRTFDSIGKTDISQVMGVDSVGNVIVSGMETWGCDQFDCYVRVATIKYDPNGNLLWKTNTTSDGNNVQVEGLVLDEIGGIYLIANFLVGQRYATFKYSGAGNLLWRSNASNNGESETHGIKTDKDHNVIITGQIPHFYPNVAYGTIKLNTNGSGIWTNFYPIPVSGTHVATGIAVDQAGNSYVTGYSPGTNTGNDIATVKYDSGGNQVWVQRYNGAANGDDRGTAIAVDKNGNVYVAGYETVAGGGTQMILIKYALKNIEKKADGAMHLQYPGSPGSNYIFQATTNLTNWTNIATNLADTNGVVQYDDTNAPFFDWRFYRTFGP